MELYVKETAKAQSKLEKEAQVKWEEEKKAEEAKAEAEAKAGGDAKKKAPPPKKGAKDAGVFSYTGPKLEVPKIEEYESNMGQKFVVERSLEAISETLMKPAPGEDEENE